MKPFAESCEQNKLPILKVLEKYLGAKKHLLEIGSGTGQHAVYFSEQFPHITWQTSDRQENHQGIQLWIDEADVQNARHPLEIDVCKPWPKIEDIDVIYSANTTHIMSWRDVECFFQGVGETLQNEGHFILYGPFNFNNEYTSESNAHFDQWLKSRDSQSGIRNFEDLCKLGEENGLIFEENIEMPANNRCLVWTKG